MDNFIFAVNLSIRFTGVATPEAAGSGAAGDSVPGCFLKSTAFLKKS
jgi:hypothetical protein